MIRRTSRRRCAALAAVSALSCAVAGCSTSFELDPRRLNGGGTNSASAATGSGARLTTEDGQVAQRTPGVTQLDEAGRMPDSALLATYAVREDNAYPEQLSPQPGLRVHAVVARNGDWVKLYNFTGEPLRDVKVWVNGAYLAPLASLAVDQSATLRRGQFFNRHGVSLAQDR